MTEGMEDSGAGSAPPPGSASPIGTAVDSGTVPEEKPEEKPEEMEAAAESRVEGTEETAEGGADAADEDHVGALGIVALPGTCCVCVEMDQINNCLHSEKICILPILACLLSLALCTAGLKWVFVDKIFEYEPPTHLDPIPIGQDPIIISVNPTLGITVSIPHSSPSTVSLTTTIAITPGRPEVVVEEKSTRGPYVPHSPRGTDPSSITLKYNAVRPTTPKRQQTAQEQDNDIPRISTTSSSTTAKTSSHVTPCSDGQKNFCVNGGECFILKITEGNTKFLCRCPNEFTGDRCQNYVMASFYKAEELYQKRILTITGICIALLVVGIMCVVAYCKTKKQRRTLRDRLRQSVRKKRNNNTKSGVGSNPAGSATGRHASNLPLQDLQFINQCNGTTMQHAAEKENETTFSTSKYALSANEQHDNMTTFTRVSTQSWSYDWSTSVLSDTESVSVMSLVENSQRATQGARGRLNATGGTSDLNAQSETCQDTPNSRTCLKVQGFSSCDSCGGESGRETAPEIPSCNQQWDSNLVLLRLASPVTTMTRLSGESRTSLTTPSSPPSEMSAPLSSLAISVPSVAPSPSGEEERPLLLSSVRQPRKSSSRDEQKRNSAHYNHGHEAYSLPSSPRLTSENVDYQSIGDRDATAVSQTFSASLGKFMSGNNNNNEGGTKGIADHVLHYMDSSANSMLVSDTEEPRGDHTHFLTMESTTALLLRAKDGNRTNPALDGDLPFKSIINQDPDAV